uniref:Peptidyl-prolyl cis-trans isomerase B (Cyclophilin B) n=1 Tax=Tetraselmis sp. GSL018 TaxID=582737 RepID=A0A061S1R7_9CHLO|mmetsp:Transcript_11096/g.26323  ORF Transcript_11096/g.26323 Transcript_11096/m.26323 type:complete len:336 (-) Transcript_11096:107-1114(-)
MLSGKTFQSASSVQFGQLSVGTPTRSPKSIRTGIKLKPKQICRVSERTKMLRGGGNGATDQLLFRELNQIPDSLPRRTIVLASAIAGYATGVTNKAISQEENELGSSEIITDRVALAVALCPAGFNQQRGLGESAICRQLEPLGEVVLGLYGTHVPVTVKNFLTAVESGAYEGTLIHKVVPGGYILGGKQGPPRLGGVAAPKGLEPNPEVTAAASFKLRHFYPGTVSLPLSVNDDDERLRVKRSYRSTEFLITTGPGPAPALDGGNVVFGRVLEGLGTVARVADVPTFSPQSRMRLLNSLAAAIGDDRAARAKASWGRPLQPVVVTSARVLGPRT